jgi:hypothetical protein
MKPARTTDSDAGQHAANRLALRIPSFKLQPSHHQSTRRGDADARNSALNSCPKQSRIVSRTACNFVDYCGCLLIFCANCRANTLRLLSCCICLARYRSRSLGAHSNRPYTVARRSTPLPRVFLYSADRLLLLSVISRSPSASTPYGPPRGGCWPMMSDKVFAIRKEGEEPSRGEIDIHCYKCPCLVFHLHLYVTCPNHAS